MIAAVNFSVVVSLDGQFNGKRANGGPTHIKVEVLSRMLATEREIYSLAIDLLALGKAGVPTGSSNDMARDFNDVYFYIRKYTGAAASGFVSHIGPRGNLTSKQVAHDLSGRGAYQS